jgi:hypothetical protein
VGEPFILESSDRNRRYRIVMQLNAMCVVNCATPAKKKRERTPPLSEIVDQTVQNDDLSVREPRIQDQEAEHNARPPQHKCTGNRKSVSYIRESNTDARRANDEGGPDVAALQSAFVCRYQIGSPLQVDSEDLESVLWFPTSATKEYIIHLGLNVKRGDQITVVVLQWKKKQIGEVLKPTERMSSQTVHDTTNGPQWNNETQSNVESQEVGC